MKFFKNGRSTGLPMDEYNEFESSVKVDLLVNSARTGTYERVTDETEI